MSARDRASPKCADAPINTLEQFRARCAVVASRYAIGKIDLIEAVDTLQDFAFTGGLVDEIGFGAHHADLVARVELGRDDLVRGEVRGVIVLESVAAVGHPELSAESLDQCLVPSG